MLILCEQLQPPPSKISECMIMILVENFWGIGHFNGHIESFPREILYSYDLKFVTCPKAL